MEITYTYGTYDYWVYAKFINLRHKGRIFLAIVIYSFILIPAIMYGKMQTNFTNAILYTLFTTPFFILLHLAYTAKQLGRFPLGASWSSARTVVLDQRGIRVRVPKENKDIIPWNQVKDVIETDYHIFVIGEYGDITIPRRVFPSEEQYSLFRDQLITSWNGQKSDAA